MRALNPYKIPVKSGVKYDNELWVWDGKTKGGQERQK
jgi:hypothetical protein